MKIITINIASLADMISEFNIKENDSKLGYSLDFSPVYDLCGFYYAFLF